MEKIREWEKEYGLTATAHLLPHDAARRDAHGVSYVENMARLGLANVRVVPRTTDVWRGINTLRELLERSFFHVRTQERARNLRGEEEAGRRGASGIVPVQTARNGRFPGGKSVHDAHSHTADAARTFAEAWSHGLLHGPGDERPRRRRAKMW